MSAMLFVPTFCAGAAYDAFVIAFRIPNLLRRLFAEGAFSQAFVPVLSEYDTLYDAKQSKLLISKVATNLFCILLLITVLGMYFSPTIIKTKFTDEPEKFAIATMLLRITFPYILLVSLIACWKYAKLSWQVWGRFARHC